MRSTAASIVVAILIAAQASAAPPVFQYCLDHPKQCALSVHHVTDGWERHLNADRLQATASTFKVLTLIVYAQAVVEGRIDPEELVAKEDWARFSIGGGGSSLRNAWERLGRPDEVTVDQMVGAMIQESDNAAPDWLLDRLGKGYFKRTLKRYIRGYHDLPESINGTFITWFRNPEEPDIGLRMLRDYSGVDALGYLEEIRTWFKRLRDPDLAAETRATLCETLPWETADPTCTPTLNLSEAQLRDLLGGYFIHSNTRTYNRLMLGVLDESLLPAAVQEIVRTHLEWPLEDPEVSNLVSRIGTKGGSLAPQNICNWTSYAENRATGAQVVTTIFLHDVPTSLQCGGDLEPSEILQDLVLDPDFADEILAAIPPETPKPDLLARFERLRRKTKRDGDQLDTKVRIRNIGPVDATSAFKVSLVVSSDSKLNRKDEVIHTWEVKPLRANKSKLLRFKERGFEELEGKYLFVRIDRRKAVAESDEGNNKRPWQVIP